MYLSLSLSVCHRLSIPGNFQASYPFLECNSFPFQWYVNVCFFVFGSLPTTSASHSFLSAICTTAHGWNRNHPVAKALLNQCPCVCSERSTRWWPLSSHREDRSPLFTFSFAMWMISTALRTKHASSLFVCVYRFVCVCMPASVCMCGFGKAGSGLLVHGA